ncbi:MAG: rod shape-determining protein MreD [Bacteroidales bacterium]|nr:rod shape-determining protein MreD [Bacteroidales bacterium]
MSESVTSYIWRFVILVLLQVFVINNIEISNHIVPYVYILFILLLPVEFPGWILLVLAFFLGLSVDIFSQTLGFHTISTVLMAYVRPIILSTFAPRDGYESGSLPRISSFGFVWFFKYTLILVFIHHLALFLLEIFRFEDLPQILLRVLLSSLFSLTFIIVSQFVIYRK